MASLLAADGGGRDEDGGDEPSEPEPDRRQLERPSGGDDDEDFPDWRHIPGHVPPR